MASPVLRAPPTRPATPLWSLDPVDVFSSPTDTVPSPHHYTPVTIVKPLPQKSFFPNSRQWIPPSAPSRCPQTGQAYENH